MSYSFGNVPMETFLCTIVVAAHFLSEVQYHFPTMPLGWQILV